MFRGTLPDNTLDDLDICCADQEIQYNIYLWQKQA